MIKSFLAISLLLLCVSFYGQNTFPPNGNAGIGTTTPTEKLDVAGNVKATGLIISTNATAGKVLTSDANGNATWQTTSAGNNWFLGGNTVGALKTFGTIDNFDLPVITNNTEKLRITASGNLLLNSTADNTAKFQVTGTSTFQPYGITFLNTNEYHSLVKIGNDYAFPNGGQTNTVADALLVSPSAISSPTQFPSSRYFRINFDGNDPLYAVGSNNETHVELGAITNSLFRIRTQSSYTDFSQGISTFSILSNYPGALMKIGTEGNNYGEVRLETRAAPISFYMSNAEAARINEYGHLLIGSVIENGSRLQVNGDTWTTGLILPTGAAAGKVLTSDANGNATWQTATGSSGSNWSVSGNNIFNANGGLVVIGSLPTTLPANDANLKLAVNGNIYAQKLKITQSGWADYVFDPSYKLRSLQEVETFIQKNNHLPEIPSAAEVEKQGIDVGDSQVVLLKKVEELTLYIIDLNKKVEGQNEKIEQQNKKIEEQSTEINLLKSKK